MQDEQGDVRGTGNRVAGRDYYENPVLLVPPIADRPGLVHCPACDRGGLSPAALICPDCGHDLMLERRLALHQRSRVRIACMATVAAAAITALNLYGETPRFFGAWAYAAIAMLWCPVLLLWWQCVFLRPSP